MVECRIAKVGGVAVTVTAATGEMVCWWRMTTYAILIADTTMVKCNAKEIASVGMAG